MLMKVGHIEQLLTIDSNIHRLHPLVKMVSCLLFVICVIATYYLDVLELCGYAVLVYILVFISHVPATSIFKRSLLGLPISLCIGISNLWFAKETILVCGVVMTTGIFSLFSIVMKNILCLSAVFLLISTTSFDSIACELVHIKVPAIFVLQLVMIYRYIFLLVEEANSMTNAYVLKNPTKGAIAFKDVGSFIGNLLVRSFARSEEVYMAMKCRGFDVYKSYLQYVPFALENYFLLLIFSSVLILIKVVI